MENGFGVTGYHKLLFSQYINENVESLYGRSTCKKIIKELKQRERRRQQRGW